MKNRKPRVYRFKNVNRLAKIMGKAVAKDADFSFQELKKYINVSNIRQMILRRAKKFDDHYELDTKELYDIGSEIFDWLVDTELVSLAADGAFDCYWDSERNKLQIVPTEKKNDSERS